jgi:hypothetical protein
MLLDCPSVAGLANSRACLLCDGSANPEPAHVTKHIRGVNAEGRANGP